MSKSMPLIVALVLAASAAPASAAVLGPDAEACRANAGTPAVLVRVEGFKRHTGTLRVQVYGSNPEDFLAKGRKLKRIDLPVTGAGAMPVCVALPKAGRYAIAVRHDLDANGKSGWSDGGGFSRNPRLSLLSLKPDYGDVAIQVGPGVKPIDVVLNYKQGLTIKPVASGRAVRG